MNWFRINWEKVEVIFFFLFLKAALFPLLQKHHAISSEAADATTIVIACHAVKKSN